MLNEAAKTYFFRALAPEGAVTAGQIAANSHYEAILSLTAKGYRPLLVDEKPLRVSFLQREVGWASAKRLSIAECQSFCHDLHILVGSGVEIAEAMAITIPSLSKRSRLYRFSVLVRQGLRFGKPLSLAIEQSGYQLPSDLMHVIRAGESAGSLAGPLRMLADGYGEMNSFARTFGAALVYPAFLLGVAIITIGIIGFFVAPNLAGLFISMDKPVPMVISTMRTATSFLAGHWAEIIGAIGVTALLLTALFQQPSARVRLKTIVYRLPLIGPILVWAATQKLVATLKLYVDSNVPMATALPGAVLASGFPNAGQSSKKIGSALRSGGGVESAAALLPQIPAKILHLIAVGERGGRLSEVLAAASAEAKSKFQSRVGILSNLLAPALILTVGILIGALIFSVFSALLEVNNLAS